jgi:hypothetical protein
MDKLEILLDMIEHPERYTEQQISDLLADEEMRKHYDVMVQLRGAYDVKKVKSERVKSEKYKSLFIRKIAAVFIVVAFLGGLAWAFVPRLRPHRTAEPPLPTKVSAPSLTGRAGGESSSISFSNLPLDSILRVVAAHYSYEVCFRDSATRTMKFITTWNPEDSLAAFIEHLNMFDGLHLTLQDDTIFVETTNDEEGAQ